MKKLDNFLGFCGIYGFGFFHVVSRLIYELLEDVINIFIKKVCSPEVFRVIFMYFVPVLFISIPVFFKNLDRKQRGQTEFGLKDVLGLVPVEEETTKAFVKATYPVIPNNIKSKKPKDLVLGTQGGKYINVPIVRDGINGFITGTPGAGKSVAIQNILLTQLYKDKLGNKDSLPFNYFLVDVDGLIYKSIYPIVGRYDAEADSDIPIKVFEPSNRNSFGWDVYYLIRGHEDNDTRLLKVVTDISEAIVPESGDNPYFSTNARKILTGVLMYGMYKKMEFVPTIQQITRSNLDELITKICKEAEACGWVLILDKLKGFVGKGTNESLQDVEATLKQYLEVFSYPDIEYALNNNPHKASPDVINDGHTNLIFSIETSMLGVYQPVFRLVVMQMLAHIETSFHPSDERNTIYIVDEAARVGKIGGGGSSISLENTFAIARKYHVSCLLFYQDLSQFIDIYGKDKAKVIQNLCEIKIFMSGSGDSETVDYLDEIVGDYVAERKNYKRDGVFLSTDDVKYTEERRPIITGKSLMSLRDKSEVILIYFGKYYRFKKIYFFKDKYLKPFYEHTKAAKEAVEHLEEEK